MKKFLNIFFVTLGAIFFIIILAVSLFLIKDPYHIRPLISGVFNQRSQQILISPDSTTKNPLLNSNQEKALNSIGVDTATLPTKITPEMAACFELKLGAQRTEEIKKGSTVTANDFFLAKDCLK